jgi:hypothetical protein
MTGKSARKPLRMSSRKPRAKVESKSDHQVIQAPKLGSSMMEFGSEEEEEEEEEDKIFCV